MSLEAELRIVVKKLEIIALNKSLMLASTRGWVSALGLHVQSFDDGKGTLIRAGGSFRSYLDAWLGPKLVIKKYDRVTWEGRFSAVVEPTLEIASFVNERAKIKGNLSQRDIGYIERSVQDFKRYGRWSGQLEEERVAGIQRDAEKRAAEIERRGADNSDMDWFGLAFEYQAAGRVRDAERALLRLIDADPDGLGHEQLGTAYFVAVLTSILGRLPNIAEGLFWFKVEEVGLSIKQSSDRAKKHLQSALALAEDEDKRLQSWRTSEEHEEKCLKIQRRLQVLANLSKEAVEQYEREEPDGWSW